MAVHIRLSRAGRKGIPMYRLVAVDSRVKRDGKVLANLGTYDALNGRILQFHDELLNAWVQKGALLTDSAKKVHKLYKKDGIYTAPVKKIVINTIVSTTKEEAQQPA
ncbi:30S ribosomal protein S16 [Candidatus Dependentiae bacterium]|nr:MAG: 30S ribosomal protein S16 [Candidatus Dependentiae bacterium]